MKTAVFLSGSGRTFDNLYLLSREKKLDIEIVLVISDRDCKGIELAKNYKIPNIIDTGLVKDRGKSEKIFDECRKFYVDLICLAGFLQKINIPQDYLPNRVMNIHPSLIPSFCGHKMYGDKVHKAVLDKGVKYTGCTVHYVDNEYDNGPIILQRICPVHIDDTFESLSKRVFSEELIAYPEAIKLHINGKLKIINNKVITL